MNDVYLLPATLDLDTRIRSRIIADYERFGDSSLPQKVEEYILEQYGIDVSSRYGRFPIKNPFGKASGQLSTNLAQVTGDAQAGLGFVVLKTVIAQDQAGHSTMGQWKVAAPHMVVERIISRRGEEGWTVTWKGRGWEKSFAAYLDFMRDALQVGKQYGIPIVPSCKYHLPAAGEAYKEEEYQYTTRELLRVWQQVNPDLPMPLEKDFSPTLAGADVSKDRENILRWLSEVPARIKKWCQAGEIYLGLKLMNAMYGEDFQLEMLSRCLAEGDRPGADFLVCFNRLFDPERVFEGKQGVAYGGYDLSDRNLAVLTALRRRESGGSLQARDIPICATGNINSGRMMVEYALRSCLCGEIHTYFQLPANQYRMRKGSRTRKALHELFFHPDNGLVAVMAWLRERWGIGREEGIIRFTDIAAWYRRQPLFSQVK
ncbi:hypothetical protein MGLY_13970 [Neomoorella glycerini]|uniref:Uncharacterized protein n=1 Tax=Neomoorella glycerini TaxID=55779 RepID=A0A6I5ZRI3_9FIRM|nr:hypothetical protein [Moorella glycerini]QGP92041.1 hypothetical protein MGLY_13970 [Moorella glycerini]